MSKRQDFIERTARKPHGEAALSENMEEKKRVCPAELGGMLDNRMRRLLHPGRKLLSSYVCVGDLILDLGCGPGSFTDALAALTGESGSVVAVDLQQAMLDSMMSKMKAKGVAGWVTPHLCDQESLRLEDYESKADFALAFWMVHETPDVEAFLKQVYNALRPGGRLLCCEPAFHVSSRKYREMIELGCSLGFKAEPVKGIAVSRSVHFTKTPEKQ